MDFFSGGYYSLLLFLNATSDVGWWMRVAVVCVCGPCTGRQGYIFGSRLWRWRLGLRNSLSLFFFDDDFAFMDCVKRQPVLLSMPLSLVVLCTPCRLASAAAAAASPDWWSELRDSSGLELGLIFDGRFRIWFVMNQSKKSCILYGNQSINQSINRSIDRIINRLKAW